MRKLPQNLYSSLGLLRANSNLGDDSGRCLLIDFENDSLAASAVSAVTNTKPSLRFDKVPNMTFRPIPPLLFSTLSLAFVIVTSGTVKINFSPSIITGDVR